MFCWNEHFSDNIGVAWFHENVDEISRPDGFLYSFCVQQKNKSWKIIFCINGDIVSFIFKYKKVPRRGIVNGAPGAHFNCSAPYRPVPNFFAPPSLKFLCPAPPRTDLNCFAPQAAQKNFNSFCFFAQFRSWKFICPKTCWLLQWLSKIFLEQF
jgi:hypothetical protein